MAVTLSQVIFIEKNNFNLKKNQIFLFFFHSDIAWVTHYMLPFFLLDLWL